MELLSSLARKTIEKRIVGFYSFLESQQKEKTNE